MSLKYDTHLLFGVVLCGHAGFMCFDVCIFLVRSAGAKCSVLPSLISKVRHLLSEESEGATKQLSCAISELQKP